MFRNPLIDALVVLIAVLLIFGPKRLPLVGRGLGHGMREFKDGITGKSRFDEAEELTLTETAAAPAAPATAAVAPSAAAGEPAQAPRS